VQGAVHRGGASGYIFEDPASLDILSHLGALKAAGVTALKIEGRQRGRAYVSRVVAEIRRRLAALDEDRAAAPDDGALRRLSEGQRTTTGSYDKRWR
jgi:putative protease